MQGKDLKQKAYYKHNNGDYEPVYINNYDNKGNAWVTWKKDNFKNMVPVNRLIILDIEPRINK